MNPIDELTSLILQRLVRYCAATPLAEIHKFRWTAPSAVRQPIPSEREAIAFLRGLDAGLIEVDEVGRVTYPGAAVRPPWPMPFFFRSSSTKPGTPVGFWWELLTQTMAYVELILDFGWPRELVGLDVFQDRFDVGAFTDPSLTQLHLAAEAKPSDPGVLKLLREMQRCHDASCGSDPRRCSAARNPTDGHKKYSGLLQLQPGYFWIVGPAESRVFRVERVDDMLELRDEAEQQALSHCALT